MKKIIFLLPFLLSSYPASSEVSNKIHKMCLQASDYSGCVKAYSKEKKQSEIINQKKNNNKYTFSPNLKIFADYQLDQAIVAVEMAYTKCESPNKKISRKDYKNMKSEFQKRGQPTSYMEVNLVKKGITYLLDEYGNDCSKIRERPFNEVVYHMHKEELSKKISAVKKEDLIPPICEIRPPKPSNNLLLDSVKTLACMTCHEAYDRNMKGKKSALSGEKEHYARLEKQWDKITKVMNKKWGTNFKGSSYLDKQIQYSLVDYCPSLY